ncbi:MAG TPA: ABC transporter ATP-binding protein [Vicinamibacterales bacterium]|jgi:ABC-type Fe3+/spermidine/putrescine transport system ATPase subunit
MPPTRVTIAGLDKAYGTTRAVDALSLEVAPGELFALVGPSGSGKSTVLRCLAGLEQPDAGTIAFDGRVVNGVPSGERHVSVVFQNYALYPHLTVFENVAFGLVARAYQRAGAFGKMRLLSRRLRHAPLSAAERARIADTIALVELAGLEARLPSALSGGQQQRVALARALVTEPRLLLMDEPLGALDARLRERVLQQLHAIHQRLPVTTIYVTHDQAEAALLATRVGVLHRGHLEQAGAVADVRDAPRSLFVADFFASPNLVRADASDDGSCALVAGLRSIPLSGTRSEPRVALLLRADRMRLASEDGPGGVRVVVRQATAEPSGIRYRVDAGTFAVDVQAASGAPLFAPGTAAVLIVPDDAVTVLE